MSKFKSNVDQKKQVQLKSAIQQVQWSKSKVAANAKVRLDIFTQFVGNGSEMKIEIADKSGKKWNSTTHITNNRYTAIFRPPSDAKESLTATVKFAKHGLEKKSKPVLLLPPIEITNAKWDKSEAR